MSDHGSSNNRKLLPGERVEVRQKLKGLRGSWHPAKVVGLRPGRRLVEYDELLTEDGLHKLRECVPIGGSLDVLRGSARHNISHVNVRGLLRPLPPACPDPPPQNWKRGFLVDVLYEDAWWEAVLLEDLYSLEAQSSIEVMFPHEGVVETVAVRNLRVSQEWDEDTGRWCAKGLCNLSELVGKRRLKSEQTAFESIQKKLSSPGKAVIQKKLSSPGKAGVLSEIIPSTAYKTPSLEGAQGSSTKVKENKMVGLKKSGFEIVPSSVTGVDRLSSESSEKVSPSKQFSFSTSINEKESRYLNSTRVSSAEFLENRTAPSGLPVSRVKISEGLSSVGKSPDKGNDQVVSNGLKFYTKEHNLCMPNELHPLSEGEKNTREVTFSGHRKAGSCSSPLDNSMIPWQHIEHIMHNDDNEAGSPECEFRTVNKQMNDIVQMQKSDPLLLDLLAETESSWSEDLGTNLERSGKATECFDQECSKKRRRVAVSKKQEAGKGNRGACSGQVFQTAEKTGIHRINKARAGSTNSFLNRKNREVSRKDMDDNLNVAGGRISMNKEVKLSTKGERLKEGCFVQDGNMLKAGRSLQDGNVLKAGCSLPDSNVLKAGCSLPESNVLKAGRSLPESNVLKAGRSFQDSKMPKACRSLRDCNMPKEGRYASNSNVLKEGRSSRYSNVLKAGQSVPGSSMLKEGRSLRDSTIRISKFNDRCINSNTQKESRSLHDSTMKISKSQDRCINVKRGLKPPNGMEQSKQSDDINKRFVRRLDQTRSNGSVVPNLEVIPRKKFLQRRVEIIPKQKSVQGQDINMQVARRLDQTRSSGSIAANSVSKNPGVTPKIPSLLKAGLKRKIENIGKEALSERGLKEKVRNIAKEALCEAGFKIELRPRMGRDYQDSVYVSPQGYTYWSLPRAWRAWKATQAETGGGRDKGSTNGYGQNVQTFCKGDKKVAGTTGSCTVVDKGKKRSVVDSKNLRSSGPNQIVQTKLLLEDLDSKVLRALDFQSNRGSHLQITKAELTDLFLEDLGFLKRVTKKSRAREAEVGGEPVLDKPVKETEVRKKRASISSLPSRKLDFEKPSGHERMSKKRLLISAVIDHPGGRKKRQKIEDSMLDKVSGNCLNHRLSSSKKPTKAENIDMTIGLTVKGLNQRKESSSGVLWRKPVLKDVSKAMKISHERLRMNPLIEKPFEKDDRVPHGRLTGDTRIGSFLRNSAPKEITHLPVTQEDKASRGRLKEDTLNGSLLRKPVPKEIRVSHGKLQTHWPVTQEDKVSSRRLKRGISEFELESKNSGDCEEKHTVSNAIRKRKAVCSDSFAPKNKKSKTMSDKQVVPYGKPAKNSGIHSGFRLEVRSSTSRKGEGFDIEFLKNRQTVLSWLIDRGVLSEREKLHCSLKEGDQNTKAGLATSDGILCKCCKKIFTISDFEAHAGSKHQSTCPNIVFKSGKSLLDCQMQAWAIESELRKVKNYVGVTDEDRNDDTCILCGDGGELICCDKCPSTFHTSCLQIEDVPEGNWYCPKCCCPVCGGSEYDDKEESTSKPSIYFCDQCEQEYHNSCVYGGGITTSDCWFCGPTCRKIFIGLRSLVGISHALDDGISWTLLRCMEEDQDFKTSENLEVIAMQHSKLAVALSVMQECFVPMVDPRTNVDMIPHVVYNRWSEFYRLDYRGFYTVLLEKGDELISVASIRIHGSRLAEMPLIGTRQQYRRQGMCRRLVNAIETMLSSLGVELFVLPAIPELLETWTYAFGFDPIDTVQRLSFNNLSMMVFPGTQLLQKALVKSEHMLADTTADIQRLEASGCLSNMLERKQKLQEILQTDKVLATDFEVNTEYAVSISRQEAEQAVDVEMKDVDIICDRSCHASDKNNTECNGVTISLTSPLQVDKVLATQLEGNTEHAVSISRQETEQAVDVESRDSDIIYDMACNASRENINECKDVITNPTSPLNDEVERSATETEAMQVYRIDGESCVVDMDGLHKLYKEDHCLIFDQIEATVDQKAGLSLPCYNASVDMLTQRGETELISSSSQQVSPFTGVAPTVEKLMREVHKGDGVVQDGMNCLPVSDKQESCVLLTDDGRKICGQRSVVNTRLGNRLDSICSVDSLNSFHADVKVCQGVDSRCKSVNSLLDVSSECTEHSVSYLVCINNENHTVEDGLLATDWSNSANKLVMGCEILDRQVDGWSKQRKNRCGTSLFADLDVTFAFQRRERSGTGLDLAHQQHTSLSLGEDNTSTVVSNHLLECHDPSFVERDPDLRRLETRMEGEGLEENLSYVVEETRLTTERPTICTINGSLSEGGVLNRILNCT